MPKFADKTRGGNAWTQFATKDGRLYGAIDKAGKWPEQSWDQTTGLTGDVANDPDDLIRLDAVKTEVTVYWTEFASGAREVTLTEPTDGGSIKVVASKVITLREGFLEV